MVFGKPKHDELDVKTLSMRQPVLENNNTCCSIKEDVSQRWTELVALSSHLQVTDSPVAQDHAPSAVHDEPINGHNKAVFSKDP